MRGSSAKFKKRRTRAVGTNNYQWVTLGKRLKYLRLLNKMSQFQLSEASGVHLATIIRLEKGRAHNFYFDTLDRICASLGCTMTIEVRQTGKPRKLDLRYLQLGSRGGLMVRQTGRHKTIEERKKLVDILDKEAPSTSFRARREPKKKIRWTQEDTDAPT